MLKKEEYEKAVRRPYPPLFGSMMLKGLRNENNFFKLIHKKIAIHNLIHSDFIWHYSKKELDEHGIATIQDWIKPGRLEQSKKDIKKLENQLIDSTNKDLKTFGDLYSIYSCLLISLWTPERFLGKIIREALLKKTSKQEVNFLMDRLNTPLEDNFYKKEEYDLIKTKDLKKHVKEYEWINSRYGEHFPYTIEQSKNKLLKLNKQEFLKKRDKEKKELKIIIKKAKNLLDEKDKILIDLIQYLVYYRTHRTDILNKTIYLYIPKLKQIAKEKGISYEESIYCTYDEMLTSIPEKKIIHERMKDYAILYKGTHVIVVSGNESEKIKKYLKVEIEQKQEFKGTIACKGKVKGKVKIVFSREDFSKVKKGDILVTSMTTPNMIPAMERAAAFVTDEGGITCHAAIVSREMNKPCIIGTKISTKVFKDGDLIEVDANKGIVKKLTK
jgi:phosphohistidine swiveling domain-containing protein